MTMFNLLRSKSDLFMHSSHPLSVEPSMERPGRDFITGQSDSMCAIMATSWLAAGHDQAVEPRRRRSRIAWFREFTLLNLKDFRRFAAIAADLTGQTGDVITADELEHVAQVVAQLPIPFEHDTRKDKKLVAIAGQGGAFAVFVVKHSGRVWMAHYVGEKPSNLYSFSTIADAMDDFERSIHETVIVRPASAAQH
jgi:hypothetical protein